MVIDDHSRMIVGGELFFNDNAANFQKVFKDAVSAFRIPSKLYVDNGCSYANEQLFLICGSLGTVLLHTRVRDGASKGKSGRQWRTLKETWLYGLDVDGIHSLEPFNELLHDYIHTYNHSFRFGIQCAPYDRYQNTKAQVHPAQSREWLDEAFLNWITRKVHKDATISIDSVSYDAPMQFTGQSVEIRYEPNDMDSAFILYEKEHYLIRKTDKVVNCHTKRLNTISIDYAKLGGR